MLSTTWNASAEAERKENSRKTRAKSNEVVKYSQFGAKNATNSDRREARFSRRCESNEKKKRRSRINKKRRSEFGSAIRWRRIKFAPLKRRLFLRVSLKRRNAKRVFLARIASSLELFHWKWSERSFRTFKRNHFRVSNSCLSISSPSLSLLFHLLFLIFAHFRSIGPRYSVTLPV